MVYMHPVPSESKAQIGDYVPRAGMYTKPGVIIEKKPNGEVVIDTDQVSIDKYHRYTITTGLTPEDKEKFNEIMDSVMDMSNNDDRINTLQRNIDDLKMDPATKKVASTLKNQQAELIRRSRELPKIYEVPGNKLR